MSYPWTDRDSFVADWSKQGEGENSSQQGLAALLGLVTAWLYFPGHPCTRVPCVPAASLVSLCCHLWCQAGALGALRESGCCGRAVGSRCWALAAGRVPHNDRAPASSPRQLDGHLQPASTQALPVSHGFVSASESGCRGDFSSPPDIWIPPSLLRAGS